MELNYKKYKLEDLQKMRTDFASAGHGYYAMDYVVSAYLEASTEDHTLMRYAGWTMAREVIGDIDDKQLLDLKKRVDAEIERRDICANYSPTKVSEAIQKDPDSKDKLIFANGARYLQEGEYGVELTKFNHSTVQKEYGVNPDDFEPGDRFLSLHGVTYVMYENGVIGAIKNGVTIAQMEEWSMKWTF